MNHAEDAPLPANEELSIELQEIRAIIPHAATVGAVHTNISIQLLAVLLAAYDTTQG